MESHPPDPAFMRLRGLDPERLLGLLDDDLDAALPKIPGWHICGVAGQGGSGIVWRAEREVDGAMAAIKIAPPYEPDTVERIEREAGFLRDLRHPNIVGLMETGPLLEGSDEGGLYMAMEFIDGPALQHEIPEHGLPPQQAFQWFAEIAAAVGYAHDCGILHRDLKPANVLLAPDGRIKVADFGLARPVHRRVHMLSLTRAGLVAGTAEYLPPEAYRRDYQPGPAADIFALGVMLHEMLTGTPPRGAWQPASSRKGVDVRIDTLIRRAMDPDPEKRWADARAMLAGLDKILNSPPRYSGTPLVTLPIRLADCIWTLLGLAILLASTSSLLNLSKTRFSLPLDLVADHSKMVGGFHALYFLLMACIPLALWQLIRLRRFRHIPMREALPSPFGLNLGHGRSAAWLVAICQLLCFLLPLSHMLSIYTNSSIVWLNPDDPPWVHGLLVTEMSDKRIVNPWKFHSFDKWFWLHESHGPPNHPLSRYVDRTGFVPGYVPTLMTTGVVLMASALLVTLFCAGRGWWHRGRRLHVIASIALLATFGTGIGKTHRKELRQVISQNDPEYGSWWIGGHMTQHLMWFAHETLNSRTSARNDADTKWPEEWYAPVVDFRDKGLVDRSLIAGLRTDDGPPPGNVTHQDLNQLNSWNPDCGSFLVLIERIEYWDAPDAAGAARLHFTLKGTVTLDGQTTIREERLEIMPLHEAPPRLASRQEAVEWSRHLVRAITAAAAADGKPAEALAKVFENSLLMKQGQGIPLLLSLDASPGPVVFEKLFDGRLIARPGKARVLGPQPGGRTRIAIPMRDPRNGGRLELMIDLVFLNEGWRGVGFSF